MARQVEEFTVAQIAVPLTIASAGLIILGIQPILLGALVETHQVTLDEVGLIAMFEIICVGLGAGFAPAIMPLNQFRIITLLGGLLAVGANAYSSQTEGFGDLMLSRGAAGIGTGLLVWIATCVIIRFHTPDRLSGIFLTGQTLAQAAVAAVFALWVIPAGSWPAGFFSLAVLILIPTMMFAWVPASMCELTEVSSNRPPFTDAVLLACVVVISQMATVGCLWTFIDPIALAAHLNQQTIQLVISGTLVMQAIGGIVAAIFAPRLNSPLVLGIGGLVQASIAAWFAHYLTDSVAVFMGICGVFGFFWLFLMPMHVQLALRVDPSGRLAVFGAGLQLLGSALGPLVASGFVTETSAAPAASVSMVFGLISAATIAFLFVVQPRQSDVAPAV